MKKLFFFKSILFGCTAFLSFSTVSAQSLCENEITASASSQAFTSTEAEISSSAQISIFKVAQPSIRRIS